MDINVKAPVSLSQVLLPLLDPAGHPDQPARVIMIGSSDVLNLSSLSTFSYGPSNASVHQLAKVLASQLANRNITVNGIARDCLAVR